MRSALLALLFLLPRDEEILIDKIAAVVKDQVITVSDIEKAIALYSTFRKREQTDQAFYGQTLQDLIHYKVIWLEYRSEFNLSEEDFEQVQGPILEKAGSIEKLRALLDQFQMEWKDFRDFIAEKVLFDKVVAEKFPVKIPISFSEIEDFYTREYLPSQQQLELQPRSLVEMAPMIEKHLRKLKTESNLAAWMTDITSSYRVVIKMKSGS